MTDQPQDTGLSLADQTTAISNEMTGALDAIYTNLAQIKEMDDDGQRLALADNTQQWVVYLDGLTRQAATILGATAEIVQQTQQQRDEAVEALAELVEAVEQGDYDHPLVAELIEQTEADSAEWAWDQTHEAMAENLQEAAGITWQQAHRLLGIFDGSRPSNDEIDELIAMLVALKNRPEN